MFDFHLHSRVSFDAEESALSMAQAAVAAGLKEICFTDHLDNGVVIPSCVRIFETSDYNAEYDSLEVPGLIIRRGMEFGMTPDNRQQFKKDLQRRPFDFVLGAVHDIEGLDIYFEPFWQDKTVLQAEKLYLQTTLECVKAHDDFDVLAHLTYIGKTQDHPARRPVDYALHRECIDAILQVLVAKGKGLEVNTSGVDICGCFLPTADILRRFRELGGQIVTVGSDAHQSKRVGGYTREACDILKDIFGYVCTFENRQPIFHKL